MPTAVHPADLVITRATPDEWATVVDWAAAEGWNPGEADRGAFFAQDPHGFFLGRVDGEPATAISVVNYGDTYAFLGFYLVRPDLRGRGFGIATWRKGLTHAGARVVGLDGVVDQQSNYRRSGFELAYRSARFGGVATMPAPDGTVRVLLPDEVGDVLAYDARCVPAARPMFLARWLTEPTHHTFLRIVDATLTGFCTVRPARDGWRVGPLFADTVDDARQLLAACARASDGASLAVDVPLGNEPAVLLAETAGLTPTFETARMYTGGVRNHLQDRVFGVTSLELG